MASHPEVSNRDLVLERSQITKLATIFDIYSNKKEAIVLEKSIDPSGDHSGAAPAIEQTYAALEDFSDMLLPAQTSGHTRGLVLHAASPRPTQTIALGGFLFEATLSRSWPAKTLLTDDGR